MKSAPWISLILMCGLLAARAPAGASDHRLDIYWNDVEGGGSTLIVTPAGESILIDAGNPGRRDSGRINKTAREIAGLRKIGYYITTHFHLDHFGGAAELSALIPVGPLYDNGIPQHDPDHRPSDALWILTSRPYRSFKVDRRNLTSAGLVLPLRQAAGSARLRLSCVACRQQFVPPPPNAGLNPLAGENSRQALPPTDNDNSSAWILEFGQ